MRSTTELYPDPPGEPTALSTPLTELEEHLSEGGRGNDKMDRIGERMNGNEKGEFGKGSWDELFHCKILCTLLRDRLCDH